MRGMFSRRHTGCQQAEPPRRTTRESALDAMAASWVMAAGKMAWCSFGRALLTAIDLRELFSLGGRCCARVHEPGTSTRPGCPTVTEGFDEFQEYRCAYGGFGEDIRTLHSHADSREESPCGLHTVCMAIPPAWRTLLLRAACASELPYQKWLVSLRRSDWELSATRDCGRTLRLFTVTDSRLV